MTTGGALYLRASSARKDCCNPVAVDSMHRRLEPPSTVPRRVLAFAVTGSVVLIAGLLVVRANSNTSTCTGREASPTVDPVSSIPLADLRARHQYLERRLLDAQQRYRDALERFDQWIDENVAADTDRIRASAMRSATTGANNVALADDLAELQIRRETLLQTMTVVHPAVIAIDEQIAELRRQLGNSKSAANASTAARSNGRVELDARHLQTLYRLRDAVRDADRQVDHAQTDARQGAVELARREASTAASQPTSAIATARWLAIPAAWRPWINTYSVIGGAVAVGLVAALFAGRRSRSEQVYLVDDRESDRRPHFSRRRTATRRKRNQSARELLSRRSQRQFD
jgi:hypothetical protein